MREIKFRVHYLDSEERRATEEPFFIWTPEDPNCDIAYVMSCEDYAVGQYTGLTDKNGKEIYEGDIVREYYEVDYDGKTDKNERIFPVEWYQDDLDIGWTLMPISRDTYEVIGNIYENPELLNPVKP